MVLILSCTENDDNTPRNGGLGSIFNNNSCNGCHPSDGRASVPDNVNAMSGLFLKISVPAGRDFDDPEVIAGYRILEQINCSSCHVASFTTGAYDGIPEISNQKIYPYTTHLGRTI